MRQNRQRPHSLKLIAMNCRSDLTRAQITRMVLGMTVLVDTREQDTDRARRRLDALEHPIERATLDYGDYAYNCTFPDGSCLLDLSGRVFPPCVIERKMNLDELAQCLCRGRERFTAEFERAKEHGADIWLLVENGSMDGILRSSYRTKIAPAAFLGSVLALQRRYGVHLVFCSEYSTPTIIRSILRADLRELLEKGWYNDATNTRMDQAL